MLLEHRAHDGVPPVGMFCDRAEKIPLTVATQHHDRLWLRPWLAVGVADLVVRALERRRRVAPHRSHHLDALDHLGDAYAGGWKRVAIRAVFGFVPPGAVTQDEAPVAEGLQAGGHLGQ